MSPNTERPRILVFDDDLIGHPDYLGSLPADFVYRPNADDALADIDEVQPSMVFMDYSMNGKLDGAQAVQAIRKVHPFAALPIVGISSDVRMNRQMLMVGASDSVPKAALPERFRDLLVLLEEDDDQDDDD